MPLGPITFEASVFDRGVNLSVLASGMTKLISINRISPPPARSGTDTDVRDTINVDVIGLWNGTDYEAPAGTIITYEALVEGDDETDRSTAQVTTTENVDYGGDYIAPVGYPSLGMNINVQYGGIGNLVYDVQRDLIPVVGRADPVAVSFGRKMWDGDITFLTLSEGERTSFLVLIQNPVLMFVARPGYGFPDPVFVSIGGVYEERTVGLGSEESRRWNVDMTQVARPPAHYGSSIPSTTWQEQFDTGDDWQTVLASNVIWYDYAGFRLT